MVLKVFSVYDSKAEAYLPPIFLDTKGLALRQFAAAANEADHNFSKYAADFTLFELGEFDSISGSLKMLPAKINLGTALEHVKTPDGTNFGRA